MNKFFALAISLAVTASAFAADPQTNESDTAGFHFNDVKIVKTTPVKNQNKSGTCWCFAGNSFFEEEILNGKKGQEVDLSEMFVVRHCYIDKAIKYIRMNGKINFSQGGSILDVPYVWARYGAMPEEAYAGLNYGEKKHVHGELETSMIGYLEAICKNPNKKISSGWLIGLEGILDAYLGKLPEKFTYNGKTYTPQSYAAELGLNMSDYEAFTSFTHHPFYEPFALEVADNWLWGEYVNVPVDELKEIVDASLDAGHSVVWAADVSEDGFKWKDGFAVIPAEVNENDLNGTELSRWVKLSDKERNEKRFDVKGPVKEIEVTQELRQQMFDTQETTDDHGMVIVGYATDQNGNRFYKVKNSWDTKQVYNGFFYVSVPYFKAKTLSILVNKNTLPKSIANKLKK